MTELHSGFQYVALEYDADTGEARIEGHTPVRGMRLVHTEGQVAGGPRYYVLRVPGHSYAGLAHRAYAPATYDVYEADYRDTPSGCDQREADAPRVRCTRILSLPVLAGTRRQ